MLIGGCPSVDARADLRPKFPILPFLTCKLGSFNQEFLLSKIRPVLPVESLRDIDAPHCWRSHAIVHHRILHRNWRISFLHYRLQATVKNWRIYFLQNCQEFVRQAK